MSSMTNQKGSVLVFVTLMIVLLLIMVGMGLDTGHLTYSRSTGQAAVDAAALSAVSALPSRIAAEVESRAAAFVSSNDYVGSSGNPIGSTNVSYVQYDFDTNTITQYGANIADPATNGVRVALEQSAGTGISTPVFLTPLFNLLGISTSGTQAVNVSAVSVINSKPALPIALWDALCPGDPTKTVDIQMQHPDPQDGVENSCWTTYLDCSSGAPDIKAGFQVAGSCSGSSIAGDIDIGTYICQNRGQVNSVLQAAEKFFDTYPNRWWVVPVLGGAKNCAPTNPTKIVTWAKIKPTEIVTTGNPKYIRAYVECGDDIREDLETSLCFSHRLVREPNKGY